jgi:hypothetical protein
MRNFTCCCCGEAAPAKEQWWNRDTGFGLCGKCAIMIKARQDYDPEEFTRTYGDEGTHWMPICGEQTLAPGDLILPCLLAPAHVGFCDTGR